MYSIYPPNIKNLKDFLKLIYFAISTLSDPFRTSMKKCRRAYYELAGILKTMTVIPALDLPEARYAVLRAAERELAAQGRSTDLVSGSLSAA